MSNAKNLADFSKTVDSGGNLTLENILITNDRGSGTEELSIFHEDNVSYFISDSGAGGGAKGEFSFRTNDGGTAAERVRIDGDGNLLVGKTVADDSTVGTRFSNAGFMSLVRDSGRPLFIRRDTTDGDMLEFSKSGTTVGTLGIGGQDLTFSASGSAGGMTWDWLSSGSLRKILAYQNAFRPNTANDNAIDLGTSSARWRDAYLSGGAYIGGTGSANYLDDYEEGTWTASWASGTMTQDSTYVKIGSIVICRFKFNTTSACSGDISGLPFVPNDESGGSVGYHNNESLPYNILVQATGSGFISFRYGNTQKGLGNTVDARGMFVYTTDS